MNSITNTANNITLVPSQEAVFNDIIGFIINPSEQFFILKGSPGVGKSTLINHIVENFDSLSRMKSAIDNVPLEDLLLTATTHDAASVISKLSGRDAYTIHSKLSLRVHTSYIDGRKVTNLISTKKDVEIENTLVIIDEAYAADYKLMGHITALLSNKGNKVLLVGDPDQLLPINASELAIPAHIKSTELTENMRVRDKNSLILPTIDKLRELVRTGTLSSGLDLNGVDVHLLSGSEFQQEIDKEFTRTDWLSTNSRVLSWTNKRADEYDKYIRSVRGDSEFIQAGDTVYANGYFACVRRGYLIPNNAAVQVYDSVEHEYHVDDYGTIYGRKLSTHLGTVYVPDDWAVVKDALNHLRRSGDYNAVQKLDQWYVNLAFRFASTVNRAQGTTLDKVYIDLNDIARCRNKNQLHRLIYVSASRARDQIFFTGSVSL